MDLGGWYTRPSMAQYRNPTKRPLTIVISHQDAPRTTVAFTDGVHDPQTGEVLDKRLERRLPESITLLGGETRELPDYAKKDALAAGLVKVEERPDEKKPPQEALKELRDKRAAEGPQPEPQRRDTYEPSDEPIVAEGERSSGSAKKQTPRGTR